MKLYTLKTAQFFIFNGKTTLLGEDIARGMVRTSDLKSIDFERKLAVTQNNIYQFEEFKHS